LGKTILGKATLGKATLGAVILGAVTLGAVILGAATLGVASPCRSSREGPILLAPGPPGLLVWRVSRKCYIRIFVSILYIRVYNGS
jgi:hypothetical protein